jgi:DNA-binding Lrp family transcriptional regulator
VLKLEEDGVISGYSITLSPAMTDTSYIFGVMHSDGSPDEVEMVRTIGADSHTVAAASYTGGRYCFVSEYHTPQELLDFSTFIRNLDGVESVELHTLVGDRGEKIELTGLHLRILAQLHEDPRMSIVDVAAKSGLTARRVRRLLSELENSDALHFRALIELGAATSIPFITRITWDEKQATYDDIQQWIQKELIMNHWETYVSAQEPTIFSLLFADSLSDILALVSKIRTHEHIKTVKLIIGVYHDYFRSLRHDTLLQLLKEYKSSN